MRKKGGVYIIIAVVTVLVLLLLQYNEPKKLNWFPSYVAHHKIPFGTYVFNGIAENIFQDTEQINTPPYEYLNNNPDSEGTYFFVNSAVGFADAELETLLDWTAKGNTLFIASESFEKKLLDTLDLATQNLYNGLESSGGFGFRLANPDLSPEKEYLFQKNKYTSYFNSIDTLHTSVLGLVRDLADDADSKYFNIISKNFGKGKIILSTFPKAFTNYFILKESNKDYTAGLLSYIPTKSTLYLDNYYKEGKAFYTSPMYIFLNNKALKWAYYLALIGAVIYIFFEGKRKQRAIPVVRPLKNQTLAFTRTIADMYYEKNEQKRIAEFKIEYFLEYIRSQFYLGTNERVAHFYRSLAARSSHSLEEVEKLFSFLERLKNQETVSTLELTQLNSAIEKFKKRADGRNEHQP